MITTRTPECRCLWCGALLSAVSGEDDPPEPDDVTVCIRCGAVMRLDENLRVRGMTEAEMDELVNDKVWMTKISKMVRGIHFMKHMAG